MFPEVAAVFAIFSIILIQNISSSTNNKNAARSDYDNDILKEILQRIDRVQTHINQMQMNMNQMQTHLNQIDSNIDRRDRQNNMRLDLLERNINNLNKRFDQNDDNIKNISILLETQIEQQMVITAEIFTVSQTLPFCCCNYQTTPDPVQPDTTTATPLKSLPSNCAEAMGKSGSDDIYKINITNSDIGPFDVYCMQNIAKSLEEETINGTWLIIQRRQDNTTDFYRNWDMYKYGFGELKRNFWIGLRKIYALTRSSEQELWIQMEKNDGKKAWAKYSSFAIGDEDDLYKLKTLGVYKGTANDSLSEHFGHNWSTWDRDNHMQCAQNFKGAWWYINCHYSNLNGVYGSNEYGKGISWNSFNELTDPLKYVHMAIRPI